MLGFDSQFMVSILEADGNTFQVTYFTHNTIINATDATCTSARSICNAVKPDSLYKTKGLEKKRG